MRTVIYAGPIGMAAIVIVAVLARDRALPTTPEPVHENRAGRELPGASWYSGPQGPLEMFTWNCPASVGKYASKRRVRVGEKGQQDALFFDNAWLIVKTADNETFAQGMSAVRLWDLTAAPTLGYYHIYIAVGVADITRLTTRSRRQYRVGVDVPIEARVVLENGDYLAWTRKKPE